VSANLAVRRDVLQTLGGFAAGAWTRVGDSLLSNDEYELGHKIRETGGVIRYQPEATVWHHVPARRLQREFFLRRAYWQGIGDAYWVQYVKRAGRWEILKSGLVQTRAALKHVLRYSLLALGGQKQLSFQELVWSMERVGRLRKELAWSVVGGPYRLGP
jgi:hypothetical protein